MCCGGPDPPSLVTDNVFLKEEIGKKVVAMIWMGNPRFIGGMPYNVGTAEEGGVCLVSLLFFSFFTQTPVLTPIT